MTTVTQRKGLNGFSAPVKATVSVTSATPAAARRYQKARLLAIAAAASIAGSVIVMIAVSLNPGSWLPPKLVMPAIGPPWDVPSARFPVGVVTVSLWLAALLGGCGVAAGLAAVRRGWRCRPKLLIGAGLISVAVLTVLPPAGSTDILDYAAYGHIVMLGHSPYVWPPYHLRADGSSLGAFVPIEWDTHVTLYGPLATFEQYLAALLGGSSVARIVFWLKLWNAIAFAVVSLTADRLLRDNQAARLRAHLLWTVNPLLLWGLIGAGHVDMVAAGGGLVGLLLLSPRRGEAAPRTSLTIAAGLFLGAAADVKIPYIIFLVAAAWTLRRSVRPLMVTVGTALAVLVPTYLWYGPPAIEAVLARTSKVTADNFYQLFSGPGGLIYRHLPDVAVGAALALAALTLARLPEARTPVVALRVALALSCAWLFVWPYQLPWYDGMIFCLLIFYPASRLDWLVLARLTAGTTALIPGDPYLTAGPVIGWLSHEIITAWTPAVLLACVAGLIWLGLTGRWRLSATEVTASVMSKPIPVST
jgi:hypothetical protein